MSSPEHQAAVTADEEAVNKVAEKIDTLRMGARQVRLGFRTVPSNLVVVYSQTGTGAGRVSWAVKQRDSGRRTARQRRNHRQARQHSANSANPIGNRRAEVIENRRRAVDSRALRLHRDHQAFG